MNKLLDACNFEAGVAPVEVPCSTHPDAPHGFDRNSSHSLDRYVCDCEGWVPPEPVGEKVGNGPDIKTKHGYPAYSVTQHKCIVGDLRAERDQLKAENEALRAQLAQQQVVLPERMKVSVARTLEDYWYARGWNTSLDEAASLNGVRKP